MGVVRQDNGTTDLNYIDGRRYHGIKEVSYVLPNDDDESDRMLQQHLVLRNVLQCDFHAPVTQLLKDGAVVLDSACGPSHWTFQMAETYPNSKFYGVDCSSEFPWDKKPANVEFKECNIAEKIPFPDNTFDYIHQRLLVLGLSNEDWESTLKELYRVLKPGGYIDLVEIDPQDLRGIGPVLQKMQSTTHKMLKMRGMPPKIATELEERLARAGFVGPKTRVASLHLNHTDKDGELFWGNYKRLYLNMRPFLAEICSEWKDSKLFATFMDSASVEAKQNKSCANLYATYAQKPME